MLCRFETGGLSVYGVRQGIYMQNIISFVIDPIKVYLEMFSMLAFARSPVDWRCDLITLSQLDFMVENQITGESDISS